MDCDRTLKSKKKNTNNLQIITCAGSIKFLKCALFAHLISSQDKNKFWFIQNSAFQC